MRLPRRRLVVAGALAIVLGAAACTFVQTRSSVPLPSTSGVAGAKFATGAAGGTAIQSAPAPGAPSSAISAPAPAAASAPANATAPTDSVSQAQTSTPPSLDRMVIRTAQLIIEVPTSGMEQALASIRQIAQQGGGFVSASNTHIEKIDDQNRTVADLTLQVRSDSTDETLSALRALGNVTGETSGSQDVTDEYVDLKANIDNLQASESAIVKLMDKATRIEDVLALQRELTNVRGQIDRLKGRQQYLERRTDMATISVSLRPAAAGGTSATTASAWNPLAVAQRGWQASLNLLRGAAEVVIVAVAFSWWLVPLAGLGVYLWQRRRPRPTPPATAQVP